MGCLRVDPVAARINIGLREGLISRWTAGSRLALLVLCAVLESPSQAFAGTCGPNNPPLPDAVKAAGYCVNTFSTGRFTSGPSGNVDFGYAYGGPHAQWFPYHHLPTSPSAADMGQVEVVDGMLVLHGDTTGPNGEIATAAPRGDRSDAPYAGTAFGGGAYVEAVLKMDTARFSLGTGMPAFWSMALERFALWTSGRQLSDQWPGQASAYEHFVEPDFMEHHGANTGSQYDGFFHDWYGIKNKTCFGSLFCDGWQLIPPASQTTQEARSVPGGTSFNQFHRYGFLWVPATDDSQGYARYYFDGTPTGTDYVWSKWLDPIPPPIDYGSTMFAILDRQHLVVILGTGLGSDGSGDTLTVRSVKVWQRTASRNLTARQPPCRYSLKPARASFGAEGQDKATVSVATPCNWTAAIGNALTRFDWITLAAGPSSTDGNGTVTYGVSPNRSGRARSGFIRVGNQRFDIMQSGQPALPPTPSGKRQ